MNTKQIPLSKYQQKENKRLFYKTEPKRVLDLIGEKETNRLFSVEDCDVGCTFFGFLYSYYDLTVLPEDYTIIDFGCCQAFQAVYFKEHQKYIGVDVWAKPEDCLRQKNAEYHNCSGQYFIKEKLPKLIAAGLDLERTFAICSYVPSNELQKMVADTFPFHRVVYCEDIISENYPDEFLEFYKTKDSFDER